MNPAEQNPHCHQLLATSLRKNMPHDQLTIRELSTIPFYIQEDYPKIKYTVRPTKERSVLHYGQLKLFLSELHLLMTHPVENAIIVYAGAAPGNHIPALAKLYPQYKFELFDPNKFCEELVYETPKNVKTYRTYFDDKIAQSYSDKVIIFISDIRTGKDETCVERDMAMQKKWVQIISPKVAMLKFRLPWREGQTEYFDGDICLPVYAPPTSTECRLIITDPAKMKNYDNIDYEEKCAFHNTYGRTTLYKHNIRLRNFNLDHCHDCSMFVALSTKFCANKDVEKFMSHVISSIRSNKK